MDQGYVSRKIENCKELIENAISPEQKKIYELYLEFWEKKITKSNRKTDTETKGGELHLSLHNQEEIEFKLKFPNKKAYYKRNGKTRITNAFKEFLIRKE